MGLPPTSTIPRSSPTHRARNEMDSYDASQSNWIIHTYLRWGLEREASTCFECYAACIVSSHPSPLPSPPLTHSTSTKSPSLSYPRFRLYICVYLLTWTRMRRTRITKFQQVTTSKARDKKYPSPSPYITHNLQDKKFYSIGNNHLFKFYGHWKIHSTSLKTPPSQPF